jgi:hypothetical protein
MTDLVAAQIKYEENAKIKKDKKLEFLNTPVVVKEIVFDEYKKIEQEIIQEARLVKSELDSSNSLRISIWSFWIAIAALALSGIQLGVDYYDIFIGKDHIYEKTTMHSDSVQVKLDSMQIEQNKKIIESLEKNKHKDTI